MLNNARIGTRLIWLVSLFLILTSAIALKGLHGMARNVAIVNSLYNDRIVPLRDLKVIADLYAINILETTRKASKGAISLPEASQAVRDAEQIIAEKWQAYLSTRHVAEEERLINELKPILAKNQQEMDRLKATLDTGDRDAVPGFLNYRLLPSINPVTEKYAELIEAQLDAAKITYDSMVRNYQNMRNWFIAIVLFGLLAASLLAFIIIRGITRSTAQMTAALQHALFGDFTSRAQAQGRDEISQAIGLLNSFLDQLHKTFLETHRVAHCFAAGQFGQRMATDLPGDIGKLATGLNASFAQAEQSVQTLSQVVQAMKAGKSLDLQTIRPHTLQGEWQRAVEQATDAMRTLQHMFAQINEVLQGASAGRFDLRVTTSVSGIYLELKDAINAAMSNLNAAIDDVMHCTMALSAGDLTERVTGNHQGDLEKLKHALNHALASLSASFHQVQERSADVSLSSQQVAAANQDLSQRIQEQASALEQTTAAMEELTAQVRDAADRAEQSKVITLDARDEVQAGAESMRDAIAAMHTIRDVSNQITGITDLIDGIAFQSNLLALNAAVEAARAGEHGRAFAVVASEVRALAQQSAEAATDIKLLIDQSTLKILEGTHKVEHTGEAMIRISGQIGQVGTLVEEIASNAGEQAQGIEESSRAIMEIDRTLQQNAALVEENAALADQLGQIAGTLDYLTGQFRLQDYEPEPIRLSLISPNHDTSREPLATDEEQWSEFRAAHGTK